MALKVFYLPNLLSYLIQFSFYFIIRLRPYIRALALAFQGNVSTILLKYNGNGINGNSLNLIEGVDRKILSEFYILLKLV